MFKIRKGVFETNSSSTHAVAVSGGDLFSSIKGKTGIVEVALDDYGWGYERLYTPIEKLSYILTSIRCQDGTVRDFDSLKQSRYYKWIDEVVFEESNCHIVLVDYDGDGDGLGDIDHQSYDTLDEYFDVDTGDEFKSKIKELIYNEKYSIIIDNDNH